MGEHRPATLTELLEDAARRHGNRVAMTSRDGLRTVEMSYAALLRASELAATVLRERFGIGPGDRVLVGAPNGVRVVAVQFGILRAGAIAVPLDRNSRPDFIETVRRRTDAKILIAADEQAHGAGAGTCIPIEDIELEAGEPFGGPRPRPEDPALIVYTSGTTGDPKGAVLTHRNIVADVLAVSEIIPGRVRLDLLSVLPLSHMLEQTCGLCLPLLDGGRIHYAASWNPSAIVRGMRRYRVTGMVVVPYFLRMMCERMEQRATARGLGPIWRLRCRAARRLPMGLRRWLFPDVHRALGGRLDFFLCGGASLPTETFLIWEAMGFRVIEGYGATECAPVIAGNTYRDRVPNSVGRPLSGVEARLSEEQELLVRGPNVFPGYWQDEALTRAAFTPDGWFRTGDLAEFGAGGRIRITGRLADRIVLASGMKVYPEDVEAALAQESAAQDCVVVGAKQPDGHESVHAVIRRGEAVDREAAAEAVARANRRLAPHQRILGFTLWDGEFPRTTLHKVRRKIVRSMLGEGVAGSASGPRAAGTPGRAADLLRRVAPRFTGTIGAATRLELDLGLDSLQRVELGALIESETGLELSEERLNAIETAGELATLLDAPQSPPQRADFAAWPLSGAARWIRSALQSAVLFPLHRLFCRPFRIQGGDNLISVRGPVLFVANHGSHVDTVSILRALPGARRRWTAVAAAADYFYASQVIGWAASLLINTFPFSRSGQVRASLERCGALCDAGWLVLIYPEGTRSPDGALLPFRSGIGLLAAGLGVPVVPVAVSGGHAILPKGAVWPRRGAVFLRFGRPLTVPPNMETREIADWLHDVVAGELSRLRALPEAGRGRRE
ncbi:MAG TPA: AMP-binding protein [Candidatus Binataceae bacterium]|nr:AMP-binding protein [Candidatus Binataceae bacterium]